MTLAWLQQVHLMINLDHFYLHIFSYQQLLLLIQFISYRSKFHCL